MRAGLCVVKLNGPMERIGRRRLPHVKHVDARKWLGWACSNVVTGLVLLMQDKGSILLRPGHMIGIRGFNVHGGFNWGPLKSPSNIHVISATLLAKLRWTNTNQMPWYPPPHHMIYMHIYHTNSLSIIGHVFQSIIMYIHFICVLCYMFKCAWFCIFFI